MRYLLILASISYLAAAQETKILDAFDGDVSLRSWDFKKKSASISREHKTQGESALKLTSDEYLFWYRVVKDWSGYDSLEFDVYLEGTEPVPGSVLIGDEAWKGKGSTYWNRHNGAFLLQPGANTISLAVNGLYRGENGSRNNDIKANIDPTAIVRLDIGFHAKGQPAAIYLDHLRLVKESRPEGILAFDFGPESQAVAPGFTPVTWNTVVGVDGKKAGFARKRWNANAARDDGFPTRLYQDFVNASGEEFVVEVPDGNYHVWLMFDDLGYWGGEQAQFQKRWIQVSGKDVWSEDRGDLGPSDYLYRFENIEPRAQDNVWDLYMKSLFKPARFEATATGGSLRMRFQEKGFGGNKIAALIVYPAAKKAEGDTWVEEVERRNRMEFEKRALYMGSKVMDLSVPPEAQKKGYWVGRPSTAHTFEETLSPHGSPGAFSVAEQSVRSAARGQRISFLLGVRPLKEMGTDEVKVSVSTPVASKAPAIPTENIDVRYVHYSLDRTFNEIAYRIEPRGLRPVKGSGLRLEKDLTRFFCVTVNVPLDAGAGQQNFTVTLEAGGEKIENPFSLTVLDLALDEPNYSMGFYGANVPPSIQGAAREAAWRDLFRTMKEYGMTALSGGPNVRYDGLDADGKPKLDYAAADQYFRIAREVGFTREFSSYGGPGMVEGLHDSQSIGETGRNAAAKAGKTFPELLKIVWADVKTHAEREKWPPIAYGMIDEPRVMDQAKKLVELLSAYREAVPFVKAGGSYSIHWNEDPFEKTVQDIFKTAVWSALNEHKQADFDKAKEFGRELYIYNQGTSRYSFGAYQWASFRRGVKGRMQWHTLALHGYQFFDLDGREPDTAMINWGRNGIIPTFDLLRCREGADDFRYAVTLWNLAQKRKEKPEAQAALQWLDSILEKIGPGQNQRPKGFMEDEAFRDTCVMHLNKLLEK